MTKQENTTHAPKMTRKDALATVYKLNARVGVHLYDEQATLEDLALQNQIWKALRVLCRSVHGEAPLGLSDMLCQICYLRYVPLANPFVFLQEDSFCQKDVCTECLERLKAEGKVNRLVNWETGEVTSC